MKSSGFEEDRNIEENINKGVRNLFRSNKLKKETNDAAIKDIRNLFRQKILRIFLSRKKKIMINQ